MNTIKVFFFATLKERAGVNEAELEIGDGIRVQDLKDYLAREYPGIRSSMTSVLVSVNREFAFDDDTIPHGAEVALFPPVSGGGDLQNPTSSERPTFFAITSEALDLDGLLEKITLPSTGAACVFTGMVREVTARDEPHQTLYLEYEAYQPMAEAKLRQVAEEIRSRWPSVEGIAIVQRVGRLEPGTPTVLVACSAAHRDTGVFEAARYGIDRLKEIVPVWKKEVGPAGQAWVEGHYSPRPGE